MAAQERHRRERDFAQEKPQAHLSKAPVGTEGVKVQKSQQTTPVGVRDCGVTWLTAIRLSQGCQEAKTQEKSHHG